jgi:hypothetical protein
MKTKTDILNLQDTSAVSYFPTYRRKAWVPLSDEAANVFWNACVKPSGGVILWDLVDATEMVLGIPLNSEGLVARSKYDPDMIRKQCKALEDGGQLGKYDPCLLNAAFEKVRRMFKIDGLKALPLTEVPYESSANSGLPWLSKKADVYPQAVRRAMALQKRDNLAPQPVVLFHRGKNETEARYVNGYPMEMSLIEGRFFYPYQQAVIQHHTPYAGGRFDFETAALINEVRVKSRFVAELDYSKFDTSIPTLLSSMAFSIIEDSFDMDEQDRRDWNRITRYFHTSPLLAPDGYIYTGRRHGVPSGSCFTQVIDSIVNAICLEYIARRMAFRPTRYLVLGDDVVLGVDRPVDLKVIATTLHELGITLNVDKSEVKTPNESIHFLGHDWRNMIATRPIMETLVRLVTPERLRKEYFSKDRDTRRAAFIERLRNYQDDNPDAWYPLQALIQFYQLEDWRRRRQVGRFHANGHWVEPVYPSYYSQFYGQVDLKESNELQRWKLEKRQRKLGNHRGQAVFL